MGLEGSMLPLFRTCCGCLSLRTGALIIGYYKLLVSGAASLTELSFALYHFMVHRGENMFLEKEIFGLYLQHLMWALVDSMLGGFLIAGVYHNKGSYLKIWIMTSLLNLAIFFASTFVLFILLLIEHTGMDQLIFFFVNNLFAAYVLLVVYSYYREAFYRERSGPSLAEEEVTASNEDLHF